MFGNLGWNGASRAGRDTASVQADGSDDTKHVPLGEPGRRCTGCAKLLARLNLKSLCFACQRAADDAFVRGQAAPVTAEQALRLETERRRAVRANRREGQRRG